MSAKYHEIMNKITGITERPYEIAKKAKAEKGQKVVGFFAR